MPTQFLVKCNRKRTKGVSKGIPNNHGVSRSTLALNRSQTQPARYTAPSWGKFTHNSTLSSRSRKHFGCTKYLRVPQWQGGGDKVVNVIDCGGGEVVAKEAYKQVQPFGHQRKPTFQFDLNEPYIEQGSKMGTEKPNGRNMIMPPKIEDEEEEDIASGFWAECPLLPFDEKIMSLPNAQMQEYLHLHLMNNNNPRKAPLQNPSPSISQHYNPTLQPYGLIVGAGSGLETSQSSSGNIVFDSPIKGLVKEGNMVIRPGGPGGARNGSSGPDGSAEFTFVHA